MNLIIQTSVTFFISSSVKSVSPDIFLLSNLVGFMYIEQYLCVFFFL